MEFNCQGSPLRGDDRGRLEGLAREVGVSERVRMADLFVMPSTGEGFGIAFLEAMASGTPALGLGVAGARDALADGLLGTAVSEDSFSATLVRLMAAQKPDPQKLAVAARARFGRRQFVASVNNALNGLIEAV